MTLKHLPAITAFYSLIASASTIAQTLTVEVEGIDAPQGQILAQLYDSEDAFTKSGDAVKSWQVAVEGKNTVTLDAANLAPGWFDGDGMVQQWNINKLPAQWVFHFGNGWEDNKGIIYFDGARADNPNAMLHDFRVVMYGDTPNTTPTRHYQYRIDTRRGRAEEIPMFDEALITEFPDIDQRVSCVRNDRLIFLSSDRNKPSVHGLPSTENMYFASLLPRSSKAWTHSVSGASIAAES